MPEGDTAAKPDLKVIETTATSASAADAALPPEETAEPPGQKEMPFAVVAGEAMTELPQDLYIPPDALEVFPEAFEGPLDLLLYVIRPQNLDILDIPFS